ncbi:MAG: ATP-binding protein [Clostridia bacterium]|nr:ATP-binding protein [Clostridia bacterium]
MTVIVLAGMPASGKSTLSKRISAEFSYPVLEKDSIKEEIFDTMGFKCYAEKRNADHAANAVLLRVLEAILKSGGSAIVDNNFDVSSAARLDGMIKQLGAKCITVFLGGETEAFYQRYVERDRLHLRHLGHVVQDRYPLLEGDSPNYTMSREEFDEKFVKRGMTDIKLSGERINVDATYPEKIDVDALIDKIRLLIG